MSFVVGTAGHIDHGKSTLITALTGIDPDRLAEEKRRGMTIDLGFAHATLPSGREIGVVDVPGHARFVRNMLAGVHGLDAVILVVAADEGVMPQTREHLEIIDLLDVGRGVVALTKTDLVELEWLEMVATEVTETLKGTSLEGSAVVGVSSVRRQGLDELVAELDRVLDRAEPRKDAGRPRLPVDRVFTMSGFGTVVTGTLVDGSLASGDELEAVPSGRTVRVRGLQRHHAKVESVEPGSRVAVNVSGVEKTELARGDVLARRDTLVATRRIDATVRVLGTADHPLRHGSEVMLHTGTAEVAARVICLDGDAVAPAVKGWIQLYLERPIAAGEGDRFVLRRPSPGLTIAGGVFVDVAPRRHARHDSAVRESLERRATGDVLQEELRKYPRGVTVQALLKATQSGEADVERLRARRFGEWLFADEAWQAIRERAAKVVGEFHAAHPLRPGVAREELRNRLGVAPAAFGAVVRELEDEGVVVERDGALALPSHEIAIAKEYGASAKVVDVLRDAGFAPPSLSEVMQQTGASSELIRALAQRGEIVRVSDDVAFAAPAYDAAVALVRELVGANGSVTVAQLRDRMGASRRPVLALLEHLDSQRVTRRVGDARTLR